MADKKPNILMIWGDDIGYWNISAYNQGMMGYKTPNIDRIAKEGALFTDWYGQQSCTAGRASFITGQVGFRTGMLKVGLPGAKEGLQGRDVTIAQLLKAQGIQTAQFGKNHLGDATTRSRPPTDLMSSLARYITSTRRRSSRTLITSKIRQWLTVQDPWRNSFLGKSRRHAKDREHRPAWQETYGND